jgi:hypothetical protein
MNFVEMWNDAYSFIDLAYKCYSSAKQQISKIRVCLHGDKKQLYKSNDEFNFFFKYFFRINI